MILVGCVEQFHLRVETNLFLQLATFAFWVTKATLTLTFKIKMWASTETSLTISFHLIVTTSKTSTQIYNKCKH